MTPLEQLQALLDKDDDIFCLVSDKIDYYCEVLDIDPTPFIHTVEVSIDDTDRETN